MTLNVSGLPVRSVAGAAALLPGIDRTGGGDTLALGALGVHRVGYYLDGLPMPAGVALPWEAVASVSTYTGHVPATYGDALSGIVAVDTRHGQTHYHGQAEALASTGAIGHRVGALSVGGPLLTDRLRLFAAAEYERWADHDPRARPGIRLRDGLLEQTLEKPQVGVEDGVGLDVAETYTAQDFVETAARPHNGLRRGVLFGKIDWTPHEMASLTVAGNYSEGHRDDTPYAYSLYQDRPISRTQEVERGLRATLALRASEAFTLRLSGGYLDQRSVTHHPNFSADVKDILFYGDLDHPANDVATRYYLYSEGEIDRPLFSDGNLPGLSVHGLFASPGAALSGYRKSRHERTFIRADATVALRGHRLTLGASAEQQTRRLFSAVPTGLARYYADDDVEAWDELASSTYADLSFVALDQRRAYYGYDPHGLHTTDQQDPEAFFTRENRDIAPHRPQRYSGYVQDRFPVGPIEFDLGLRIDAFDNNTPVLFDPYSPQPIVRAGELPERPANIGESYAVYFIGDEVAGYRDLQGQFYDETGQRAKAHVIIDRGGRSRASRVSAVPLVLTDGRIHVAIQPRLYAEVDLMEQTSVFVYYDRLARQPIEHAYASLLDYERVIDRQSIVLNNTGLKPEQGDSYGIGVRQHVETGTTLTARGFVRTYENMVSLNRREEGYPNVILAYDNVYSATVRGVELTFTRAQRHGLSVFAGYTLQAGRRARAGDVARPLDFDRTHQLKLVAAYRLGQHEGPRLWGIHPLAGLGLSIFADIKSGQPYTTRQRAEHIEYVGYNTLSLPEEANDARMPWSQLVNLRLERTFTFDGVAALAYLSIDNVFDRDNVIAVYGLTGEPDDDGFLDSPVGQDHVEHGVEPNQKESFVDHYRYRAADPEHFGIPRIVRLGLQVGL